MARSGDTCGCGVGVLSVYATRRRGDSQVQYLRCSACGSTAKAVVPADMIRRRRVRTYLGTEHRDIDPNSDKMIVLEQHDPL